MRRNRHLMPWLRVALAAVALAFASGVHAAPSLGNFIFESEIPLPGIVGPTGIDVDASGGLYFVTFQGGTSGAAYIADPIGAPGVISEFASPTVFVGGRGLQDIEVDSVGNVYICGDNGSGAAAVVRKYGPAPTFTADATFNAATAANIRRHSGITLLGDGVLGASVTTAQDYVFYNTVDGSDAQVLAGMGADTFQRDPTFNPDTNDIYQSYNTGSNTDFISVISGGTPSSLAGYTEVLNNLVSSALPQPNIAALGTDYYPAENLLLVRDASTAAVGKVHLYLVTGSGASTSVTLHQTIDASTTPAGAFSGSGDQVFSAATTPRRIFVSDFGGNRILVFQESFQTATEDYALYR